MIAKDHMSQTRMKQDVKRSMAMTLQSHNKISMNHKSDQTREIASLDREQSYREAKANVE